MGNLFQEVLQDANTVQDKLLGPTYPYYKNIKTPESLGMSTNGSISTLGNNIDGLIDYVEVLVSGKSKASKTGGPLGNKFFLKTGAKCLDKSSNQQVDRYIYVDNVPDGSVPFLSSGMGVNFTDFEGLIPGAMGDLEVLNPFNIMRAFLEGSTPDCQEITMETINNNNDSSSETHYVTTVDIKSMDPCSFPDNKNPVTNVTCKEGFSDYQSLSTFKLPQDTLAQIYMGSLTIIGIIILIKLMQKTK